MEGWYEDLYFKKRIRYSLKRQEFQFDTAELLFSTHDVDLGTHFLLRRMIDQMGAPRRILDLGSGYGVIGIVLAKFLPQAQVLMVDKDLLAVHYSEHNARINALQNVSVMASIGVDNIPQQAFDLIVSNIPGHVGDRAIEHDFILRPLDLLETNGAYWFVVVIPLEPIVRSIAEKDTLNLEEVARRRGHIVYKITKG